MRKFSIFSLLISFLIVSSAQADTIHLKNGSVLKGKVASFADEQFVVMLDTGSGRYMSRAMIYIGDVSRIEFDAPSNSSPNSSTNSSTDSTAGREAAQISSAPTSQNTDTTSREGQPRDSEPRDSQPRSDNPPESQPTPVREPEVTPTERPTSVSPGPATDPSSVPVGTNEPTTRKVSGPVRTATIDVAARRDWTSTGLIVKRGDRLRITATGSVTLDPASGQASGPEGSDLADAKKLMADRPTGALIGVIGADNDDFIFIGGQTEFTARRDGLLFLSVNEGTLSDNTGVYKAIIELQTQR
jgi:sRNA-binding regulator protein Hfq